MPRLRIANGDVLPRKLSGRTNDVHISMPPLPSCRAACQSRVRGPLSLSEGDVLARVVVELGEDAARQLRNTLETAYGDGQAPAVIEEQPQSHELLHAFIALLRGWASSASSLSRMPATYALPPGSKVRATASPSSGEGMPGASCHPWIPALTGRRFVTVL